jgi:UDP-N-acetylglucosamine diphosphorylase/glucosamine-1-phosphate N-acetyltransferase
MLPKTICIYEDEHFANLYPLTHTRPVFELLCGTMSLGERIRRFFPDARLVFKCREAIIPTLKEKYPSIPINLLIEGPCLYINGSILFDESLFKKITSDSSLTLTQEDRTVAFWNALSTKKENCDARVIRYAWDLIKHNPATIVQDFKDDKRIEGKVYDGVHLIEAAKIAIGKNSIIKPGVVLDAEHGPIIIGEHVTVMPNAVIEGPCYIGNSSAIKVGAKIYEGTSIGPVCKVGGEVEASIIQGYSNKQHDGFLGHSYIGEWCNLGADTNTSDLKNNYGSIKMNVNGKEVDTGSLFVGLMMGDHSKSGINTMFNTGTTVGVSSNIFGAGFPPKTIPSFAWVDGQDVQGYRLDKAIEVARTVMARRNVTMTDNYTALMKYIFEITAP